jgi:antitoxin CptB
MINAENLRDAEQRRFAWRCRRGLLELDIVLQDFVNKYYTALNLEELQAFDAMLTLPDNDFWALMNGSGDLDNNRTPKMDVTSVLVRKIKSVRHNNNQEFE